MASNERRKKPRVSLDTEALIEIDGQKSKGRVRDLAAEGIAVSCQLDQEVGQKVKVHFQLPNSKGWMATEAMLVRAERNGRYTTWGIRFQRPDPKVLSHIECFIREQLTIKAREKHAYRPTKGSKRRKPAEKVSPVRRFLRALLGKTDSGRSR